VADFLKQLIDGYGRSPEERAKLNKLVEDVNIEASAKWGDPEWHREMARVITESILEGFRFETVYDQILRTERVGMDDRVFIEETTGLRVFYIAKGGNIEASSLVSEVLEMPRDTLAFHVYEFEDKMRSGFAKSAAEMRRLAVERLNWGVYRGVQALIQAAVPNGSPYYIAGAGITEPALQAAIREVRDVSPNGNVTIVGRSTMVDQIADFDGYADEALEEIRRRGRLGVYRGATIISVPRDLDETGTASFPANEMYVVAENAGRYALYGGILSKEYLELDNWYWHFLGRQDIGGVIYRPDRIRRFVDTSITP
jgi:hypothetical protein